MIAGTVPRSLRYMGLLGLLLAGPALAQQPQRATPRPQPTPATAPAEPQETTANFADWTLRCLRRVGQALRQLLENCTWAKAA